MVMATNKMSIEYEFMGLQCYQWKSIDLSTVYRRREMKDRRSIHLLTTDVQLKGNIPTLYVAPLFI